MKLITKTSRYYFLFALPVLVLAAFLSYRVMLYEIGESNEHLLLARMKVVEKHLIQGDSLILEVFQDNRELLIKEIPLKEKIEPIFSDTLLKSEIESEYVSYKTLKKSVQIDSKNYLIQVWKSSIEIYEILEVIFFVFISVLILLLLTVIFINIRISERIWSPFFETLKSVKNFRVSDKHTILFKETSIDEFQELNKAIHVMTDKMILDYTNQKKFTENASHEFQTPLAIIKSKIDLLMQSEGLTENDMKLLASIDDATSRLSKINKSLLLLSKIENGQFQKNNNLPIRSLLDTIIEHHEDYILSKNLVIENTVSSDYTLLLNEELAYILLTNLVQNAIRHNVIGGKIRFFIKNNSFWITNSGESKELDNRLIFERFEKKSQDVHSVGLGLSIVKEIVDFNTIEIKYFYEDDFHCFTLFQKKQI